MTTVSNRGEGKIRPVILSGGFGKRLWPVSRDYYPKQFARLIHNESLFSSTLKRVSDRSRYAAPFIIGNIEHTFFILETLHSLNITDATVMLETIGRNTATAAIITALHEREPDMLHLVMPSDHYIADEAAFHGAVLQGPDVAVSGNIVLFGMMPERPDTGFGYIIPGRQISETKAHEISVFSEKPNETFARILINQGALWNSGIFFYHPAALCEEAGNLAPKHYRQCQKALQNAKHDKKCITLLQEDYEGMESYSLDTLIMERTHRGAVLPCTFGWSDIGSWTSLWQIAEKDRDENATIGSVIVKDVKNSYIRSEGISVAALGMENCLIIATQDTVLVAPSSKAQEIKGIVPVIEENLKSHRNGNGNGNGSGNGYNKDNSEDKVSRPWGTYREIARGEKFLVKQIIVLPGCAISLQSHEHRSEHWVVISGKATTECEGTLRTLLPHEPLYIPQGAKHRLTNDGNEDLQIIEVQSGNHLSEDDILRFEDLYGRT